MSSVYDFLRDASELDRFVELFIPDLGEDEALILMLMARRKYLSDKEQETLSIGNSVVFRREVVTRKEQIASRVEEMCVRRGLYTDREGNALPDHAFAVYLTVNPRSQRKAALATLKELADRLYENQPLRVDETAVSQLHKAAARKLFLDFDVDAGGSDDLSAVVGRVRAALGSTPTTVVETRGGAHVLVRTKEIDGAVKKSFYKDIQAVSREMSGEIEVQNDGMLPVPGTSHGGTIPRILSPIHQDV